jgi:hypothetical protein
MGTADTATAQHRLLKTALDVSSKGNAGFTTSTGLRLDAVFSGLLRNSALIVNERNGDFSPVIICVRETFQHDGNA